MGVALASDMINRYTKQGFLAPIRVMPAGLAEDYRFRLERASAVDPGKAQAILKLKSHLVFGCLNELVRHPAVLDAVEGVLGPDILVWTSSMFSKKAASPDFVSWHQDIAYWGLEPPDIVTAWIALTDSSPDNGCMRVVPGTHKFDVVAHRDTFAADNMLSRGQEVAVAVDEAKAVDIVLEPGEMSLHHTKIVHGSNANLSSRPRQGFAIRYIAPSVRQAKGAEDSVMLVRGSDPYQHFHYDPEPRADYDLDALPAYDAICERMRTILMVPKPAMG
jgi:non-haem Fe2+, alpha-ketoglutarate-dependent halogenase